MIQKDATTRVAPAQPADARIGVVVLTGALGSGKTSLLNRLLHEPAFARSLVVVNEFGDIGVDHDRVLTSDDRIALIAGGCLCCAARGQLADTLRDAFLAALGRRTPPFARVVIETTGLADPAGVRFTLRHDAFLAQRYRLEAVVACVDSLEVAGNAMQQTELATQLAQADLAVVTKTDLSADVGWQAVQAVVAAVHPGLDICRLLPSAPLPPELGNLAAQAGRERPVRPGLFAAAGPAVTKRPPTHEPAVESFVLGLHPIPDRAGFHAGMDALQDAHAEALLRVKGHFTLAGEAEPVDIDLVHRQRYLDPHPVRRAGVADGLASLTGRDTSSDAIGWLVFIVRRGQGAAIRQQMGELFTISTAFRP